MSRTVLPLIAITFAAGIFLGYLIRASSGDSAAPTPRVTGESHSAPVPPEPEEFPVPTSYPGSQSLASALASIPLPEYSPGTGVLTGNVRLKQGGPLAGVLVRAERLRPFHLRRVAEGPPVDLSLANLVEGFVQAEHLVRSTRSECRTDAEGRYAIPGLAAEKHRVTAYLVGYDIRTSRGGAWHTLPPGETADFVARPMVKVPVRVLLADGGAAETAKIFVEVNSRVTTSPWTREKAEILIPPGRVLLRAVAGQDDMYTSPEMALELVAGQSAAPVELRVEDLPGIMGKVIPVEGSRDPSWRVVMVPVADGGKPSPDLLNGKGESATAHRSRGWTFAFRDLRPGTYVIGVTTRMRGVKTHAVVKVGNHMVRKDLDLAGPESARIIMVRVEAPDGAPVPKAVVRSIYRAPSSSWSGGAGAPQGDGTYRLPHRDAAERARRPGGRYFVEAFTRTYGTERVAYDPDGLAAVCIRYQEPATLDLTLTGYTDTPYQGNTTLTLTTAVGAEEGTSHRVADYGFGGGISASGERRYAALQPAGYDFSIRVSTSGGGWYLVAAERLVLIPGSNRKTIALPPLHTLTVLVKGEPAEQGYRLGNLGGSLGHSGSREGKPKDGLVVFRGIPSGDYVIRSSGGGVSERMFVTMGGDLTVSFRQEEATALRVNIHREVGYLFKAGARDGDLVIGIDGEEFASEARMEAALALAREKPTVTLTILRGGSRVLLPIDPRKMVNRVEAGGNLEPAPRK